MRVRAEAAHRLRLAHDALAARRIEPVGLDQRERDVPVQRLVMREKDLLLPALAQEPAHVVPPADEGSRLRRVARTVQTPSPVCRGRGGVVAGWGYSGAVPRGRL